MTDTMTRPSTTARRTGYLVAALLDVVLLVLINVTPGWQVVPVLTGAAAEVVIAVDVALAVALVVNLVCAAVPRPPVRAVGDVVSTATGLVAVVRALQVFPFTFPTSTTDWATVTRLSLVAVVVVVSIALLVQLVVLARVLVQEPLTATKRRTR